MSHSPTDRPAPRFPLPAPPSIRLYVVFQYQVGFSERRAVAGIGTVCAPNLAAARELGDALAHARGFGLSTTYAVRTRRAGACRPAWLWEALARDGAATLARERTGHGP